MVRDLLSVRARFALAIAVLASGCRDFYIVEADAGGAADAATGGPDGGPEAAAEGGATASPCANPPAGTLLCDDFDTGALGAAWTHTPDAFASLDTVHRSAPRSLRVDVPKLADDANDYLGKVFAAPPTGSLVLAMDLRTDRSASGGFILPWGIFFGADPEEKLYAIALALDGAVVEQGPSVTYTRHPVTLDPAVGEWRHLELLVRRGAGTITLTIDGKAVLTDEALVGKNQVAVGGASLRVGLFAGERGATWEGHFDNVVLRAF